MDNNFQDKINQILSDPAAMEQLKSLGAMMGLDTSQTPPAPQTPSPPPAPPPVSLSSVPAAPALGNLNPASLLGNADVMSSLARVMPLMQNLNSDDETTRLLEALRPFLSDERRDKLEKAKQMIRLFKILPLLKNSGIF